MPKTNDNTGATAAGMTGIVQHGAPLNDGRVLSELDPERNLDGTLIEGEHPDRDENGDFKREFVPAPDAPQPIDYDGEQRARDEREDGGQEQGDRDEREHRADDVDATFTPLGVKAAKDENAKTGDEGGEDVSAGTSSAASQPKTGSSSAKSAAK